MQKITKVGIVGRGEFSKLIKRYTPNDIEVVVFHRDSDYSQVSSCGVLFLSIPIQSYVNVIEKIKDYLSPETLLVDVCSVKVASQKCIAEQLPAHGNVLISHPMFGPQTAITSLAGRQLVVCEETGSASEFVALLQSTFKLSVIRMSAEEHDKTMAQVHALTLFLARGVSAYGVKRQQIHAPSFDWILGLAELDTHHSDALMETIEIYNPYAAEARTNILKNLTDLDALYSKKL